MDLIGESAGSGAFILMKRYCGNACGDNPCKKGISYESRIVGLKRKRYCGNGLCKNCAVMQSSNCPAALPYSISDHAANDVFEPLNDAIPNSSNTA